MVNGAHGHPAAAVGHGSDSRQCFLAGVDAQQVLGWHGGAQVQAHFAQVVHQAFKHKAIAASLQLGYNFLALF